MQKYRYHIIILVLLVFIVAMLFVGPIPQDLSYHNFADKRMFFGISNFWDVFSNVPMFFLGLYSFYISFRNWNLKPDTVSRLIPVFLSLGIFGASFGSAYYHWDPYNESLVWDRLPMTLMFMPLFSLLLYDFIGRKLGAIAFYILIPLGIFSIFYWQYTESIGQGDLRLYAFVQFFPMIIVPFIIWLFPRTRNYKKYILYILAWYILAKIAEYYDVGLFELTGFWSGHTIKHFLGAVALYYIIKLLIAWEEFLIHENSKFESNKID